MSSILKPFLTGGADVAAGFDAGGVGKLDDEDGLGASSVVVLVPGIGDGGRSSGTGMSGGSGNLDRNRSISDEDSDKAASPAIG